ncbi:hypothetical protein ARMGADRAFT_915451 [Armillaria gallica]|uniref:Uncharacterized protein n=1 Tax=Armillaria gallica TaxID=47427 RepID=A0A2H3ESH6_ARMGA|nr:hypothetical protein ARMGADRAFT_915451 [Armillaria gallica]
MIPRNWSSGNARLSYSVSVCWPYIGSAVSIPGLMGVTSLKQQLRSVSLCTFLVCGLPSFSQPEPMSNFAYDTRPIFMTPLQAFPALSRNPAYMATLFLFILFQIPIVMAKNMSTVLAFRFLSQARWQPCTRH